MHSFLPPSGAAAWVRCPMWPTMNAQFPKEATPESMEGDTAHWIFAEMLSGRYHDIGAVAPNGTIITEEMIEGAELFVETLGKRKTFAAPLNVEQPVVIKAIHKDCWGTPDSWSFDQTLWVLDVFDYKFGHRFVDEYENYQGISYISGIINDIAVQLGIGAGEIDQLTTVNFTIVQPRCFYKGNPVRTWSFRAVELRGYVNNLANAAAKATNPLCEAITNSECGNCPGRHACQALQQSAYRDAEYAVTSTPVQLSPAAAGLELRMMERSLERLQARVEGLQETVTTYIRQGHAVPWYKVEQGHSRKQWAMPPEQVISMGSLMGIDLSKQSVKTPNEAQKLGIDEAVIKAYSLNPPGKIKLVPVNSSDARRVFESTKV